jgi:hypothetical protein
VNAVLESPVSDRTRRLPFPHRGRLCQLSVTR